MNSQIKSPATSGQKPAGFLLRLVGVIERVLFRHRLAVLIFSL